MVTSTDISAKSIFEKHRDCPLELFDSIANRVPNKPVRCLWINAYDGKMGLLFAPGDYDQWVVYCVAPPKGASYDLSSIPSESLTFGTIIPEKIVKVEGIETRLAFAGRFEGFEASRFIFIAPSDITLVRQLRSIFVEHDYDDSSFMLDYLQLYSHIDQSRDSYFGLDALHDSLALAKKYPFKRADALFDYLLAVTLSDTKNVKAVHGKKNRLMVVYKALEKKSDGSLRHSNVYNAVYFCERYSCYVDSTCSEIESKYGIEVNVPNLELIKDL